jgi:hypothetical protein
LVLLSFLTPNTDPMAFLCKGLPHPEVSDRSDNFKHGYGYILLIIGNWLCFCCFYIFSVVVCCILSLDNRLIQLICREIKIQERGNCLRSEFENVFFLFLLVEKGVT